MERAELLQYIEETARLKDGVPPEPIAPCRVVVREITREERAAFRHGRRIRELYKNKGFVALVRKKEKAARREQS